MDPSWTRKTSKWCNEQRVKKVMALNRKEENVLQQKLDQLHREENHLLREHEYEIWKTGRALNGSTKKALNGPEKSKLLLRRNSLPFVEPTKSSASMMNARRWHSLTGCSPSTSTEKPKDEHGNDRKANDEVLFEIENNFKFLSIAFGTRPTQSPTSSSATKLPEIKTSSVPGSTGSSLKAALMRRRHSDVTTLRESMQRHRTENRRSSLANIHEFGSKT